MKRYTVLTIAAAMAAGTASAQNLVDAVRFSSTDLGGSARYRSMAGAFGALGGDPSCMIGNPAGLAIYRGTNVINFTPNLNFTSTETKGSNKENAKDDNMSVANFAGILSFKNPESGSLVNFNIGIGFERKQENFRKYNMTLNNPSSAFGDYLTEQANEYLYETGFTPNALIYSGTRPAPPLLSELAYDAFALDFDGSYDKDGNEVYNQYHDGYRNFYKVFNPVEGLRPEQAMRVREKNRHDEYNLSGSFNFNDVFYIGANLKITDFNSTIETEFDELYPESKSDALFYDNTLETKGSGVGVNMGILWRITDTWRIGAAVHTPTWMDMKEIYSAYIETKFLNSDNQPDGAWSSYNDSWEYCFQTPWEYQASAAVVLGSNALLSVEWDMRDFTSMKYSEHEQYHVERGFFNDINDAIKNNMQMQHTFRIGAEYRIDKALSARMGYAYVTSPYKEDSRLSKVDSYNQYLLYSSSNKLNYNTIDNQQYLTFGLGYRLKKWYFDLSCVNQFTNEYIAAYPADYADSNIIDMSMYRMNWDLTFGYRF